MNGYDTALEKFASLLEEQAKRVEKMKTSAPAKDFSHADRIVIGVIPGDGIGKYIVPRCLRVLNELIGREISDGKVVFKPIDGLTIENRMEKNVSVPGEVLSEIKKCDVLLKGPTTTPGGGTMESANVTLRRELDLYANVRPVRIPERGIDWTFFRENTEGEYVLGSKGLDLGDMAVDFKITTVPGTERIARAAFGYAAANGKKRVTVVTKANIMKKTDGMFSEVCRKVAEEYPGISVDERYIDIACADLLCERGESFEVVLLPNLYGDIITDEAAQILGGVGKCGSANIGDRFAMFEAIHGSAPGLIEQGLGEYASPESIMRAAAMMLRHVRLSEKADALEKALDAACESVVCDGTKENADSERFTDEVIKNL